MIDISPFDTEQYHIDDPLPSFFYSRTVDTLGVFDNLPTGLYKEGVTTLPKQI